MGRENTATFTPTGNESSALSTQSTGRGEAGALRTLLPGPTYLQNLEKWQKKKITLVQFGDSFETYSN